MTSRETGSLLVVDGSSDFCSHPQVEVARLDPVFTFKFMKSEYWSDVVKIRG